MSSEDRYSSDGERAQDLAGASPESLARVEAIFFEVSSISPKDRDEAIVRLCIGDAALESEVRSLIGSAVQLGSFLEQPALGKQFDQLSRESKRPDLPDELLGSTLGAFTIERRIASGGMGTVYLAARSDGQFEQKVAVKVVKRGMDTEEILRRFRTERQTLAALDHPNIARLLDGGVTPDGRPFVVMEFIDGEPIDAYCDNRGLGLRERLNLFLSVCAGVQHAHQNLVIHRDIKPSNILVTPQGVPKLLDFGIAKVIAGGTGDANVTADTDRRLTPEYASPEQVAGGGLTTASDVYSLGVVLYELLTGARPYHFGLRTSEEVRRVVCTLEPLPPSQAVTVKASRLRGTGTTAGDQTPSGRQTDSTQAGVPPTAGASPSPGAVDVPKTRGVSSTRLRGLLRGDLDIIALKALRKEPHRRYVSAEQFAADIGRFLSGMPVQARRDTLAYRASKFVRRHGVAVALTATTFLLLTTATVVLLRLERQLQRQKSELIATNKRLDENLTRVESSRRFLTTVIRGAAAARDGPDAKLGDVLKSAIATLRETPPGNSLALAAAEEEAGRAMMSLGMLDDAKPLLEDADKLYAFLPADSDERIDSALSLARLAFYRRQFSDAESRFRSLLAVERVRNAGSPTVRESEILNDLGSCARLQGRTDESISMQRDALRVTIAVLGESSLEAAETRNNLASSLFQKGDTAAATEEFAKAYAARRALLRSGHPLLLRSESNLGLAKLRLGQAEEAIPLLTEAAEGWDTAFGPEHPGRVATMTSLAEALRKQHRYQEGLDWLQRALAWQQSHQPEASVQIAATEANIGIALAEQGEDAKATVILTRVLPTLRSVTGVAGVAANATEALARVYQRAGDDAKAREVRELLQPK